MIKISRERIKTEILRNASHAPGFRRLFKSAEQKLPGILLEVGLLIRDSKCWSSLIETRQRLGHQIKVLRGMQGNNGACACCQTSRPHPASENHGLRMNRLARGQLNAFRLILINQDTLNFGLLVDRCAAHFRAFGKREGCINGIGLPVARQKYSAQYLIGIQSWPIAFGVVCADDLAGNAKGASHGGLA